VTNDRRPFRFDGGPPREQLEEWIAAGHTDTEMGILAGLAIGAPPATKQTVAYWRNKNGLRPRRSGQRSQTTAEPLMTCAIRNGEPEPISGWVAAALGAAGALVFMAAVAGSASLRLRRPIVPAAQAGRVIRDIDE
jgi:hypothetical protein